MRWYKRNNEQICVWMLSLLFGSLLYRAFGGEAILLNLGTQSIGGVIGVGVSLGTILMIAGIALFPFLRIPGIILTLTGVSMSGGSIFLFLKNLAGDSQILFIVLAIGLFALLFSRIVKKR